MKLETERFLLQILNPNTDNLDAYLSWMRDKNSNLFIQSINPDMTLTQLREYIIEKNLDDSVIFFGIFDKSNMQHIGNVKLEPVIHGKHAVLGILIGEQDWRGQGVGFEVLSRLITFCFIELNLRELRLAVDVENTKATALYRKLGFKSIAEDKFNGTSIQMILENYYQI